MVGPWKHRVRKRGHSSSVPRKAGALMAQAFRLKRACKALEAGPLGSARGKPATPPPVSGVQWTPPSAAADENRTGTHSPRRALRNSCYLNVADSGFASYLSRARSDGHGLMASPSNRAPRSGEAACSPRRATLTSRRILARLRRTLSWSSLKSLRRLRVVIHRCLHLTRKWRRIHTGAYLNSRWSPVGK